MSCTLIYCGDQNDEIKKNIFLKSYLFDIITSLILRVNGINQGFTHLWSVILKFVKDISALFK